MFCRVLRSLRELIFTQKLTKKVIAWELIWRWELWRRSTSAVCVVVSRVLAFSTFLIIFSMNLCTTRGQVVCVRFPVSLTQDRRKHDRQLYGWNVFFLNVLNEKKPAKKMKRLTTELAVCLDVCVCDIAHQINRVKWTKLYLFCCFAFFFHWWKLLQF